MNPLHWLNFKQFSLLTATICFALAGPMRAQDNAQSANSITTVLKQGLSVAGIVLASDGQPIEGAQVRFEDNRFGTDEPTAVTDATGHFESFNCKPKKSIVTVEAEGYAPQCSTPRPSKM